MEICQVVNYNYRQMIDPFDQTVSIVDCGDFPISPFDNALALVQMEEWYESPAEEKSTLQCWDWGCITQGTLLWLLVVV